MAQFRYLPVFALVGFVSGCAGLELLDPSLGETGTAPVPSNPFGSLAPQGKVTRTTLTSGGGEGSARVNGVGWKLVAANPQLGVKPMFATIGSPQPELFHKGTTLICITDGLVKRCKTDDELAALLSYEMGRMISEREMTAAPKTRNPEPRPPIDLPMGNAGQVVAPDPARVAELVRYEKEKKRAAQPAAPPDPKQLARTYLENAGFGSAVLETIGPMLDAADRNYLIERQFRSVPTETTWTPSQQSEP